MSPDRWEKLKGELKDKFTIIEEGTGELEGRPGSFEFLVFDGPMGRMKLELTTQPVVLDKKTTTSRRIGASVAVEYVYSEDEFSHKLGVYKWDEGREYWEEIKAKMFED
ncbi:MAG: hypothetical protein WCT37_00810 [Patescibacteria group bacterium]|jgi:hypothetical protein